MALPFPNLIQNGIGDVANQIGRNLQAIEIKQVGLDVLPHRQTGGVEANVLIPMRSDPVFSPRFDPPLFMSQRSCCGQCRRLLSRFLGGLGAGFVAVAVVAGFQNVAAVSEPIQERGCHLCVVEYLGPFGEAEIGGDDHAGALVEFAQEVEQQCSA